MTDASTTGAVESIAAQLDAEDGCGLPHLAADTLRALVAERDAAIQRAEAAEADQDRLRDAYIDAQVSCGEALIGIEELQKDLTAARAQSALAWEAAYAAGLDQGQKPCACHDCIALAIPPADLSAALTARLDAELERIIGEAKSIIEDQNWSGGGLTDAAMEQMVQRLDALRRAAPTEGEA